MLFFNDVVGFSLPAILSHVTSSSFPKTLYELLILGNTLLGFLILRIYYEAFYKVPHYEFSISVSHYMQVTAE